MNMRSLCFLGLAGLLAACSGDPDPRIEGIVVDTLPNGAVRVSTAAEGAWHLTGTQPWRIVEELRIGEADGEGPYLFGSARNVIPDALGRIWVLDSQALELRLFDADGQFIRTVGGPGQGPGEFSGNTCAFAGPDGEIWVESLYRWHRFDSAGVYLASIDQRNDPGCGYRQWTPDGRLLTVSSEMAPPGAPRRSAFVVHAFSDNGDLVPTDSFPTPTLPSSHTITWTDATGRFRIGASIPFVHRPTWVLGPMGELFVTDGNGEYTIRRTSLAGDTLLVMGRSFDPVRIADEVRDEAIEGFRRDGMTAEPSFSPALVPTFYPPFDRYSVGADGTLWVRSERGDPQVVMDVFSADGRFLGSPEVPADFDQMFVHYMVGDRMYGTARDEWGLTYAVRLRIERPGR